MTRGWWRRNALALVVTAVLVPATALAVAGNEWWSVYQGSPVFPTTAAVGDEVEFAGAVWGPASARTLPPGAVDDIPAGARVVVVEVPVDPRGAALECSPPTLRELTGQQRQWDDATYDIDWRDDRPPLCDPDATGPFTIAVPFLVPDDASGPFGVDLLLVDETPGFLRLSIAD